MRILSIFSEELQQSVRPMHWSLNIEETVIESNLWIMVILGFRNHKCLGRNSVSIGYLRDCTSARIEDEACILGNRLYVTLRVLVYTSLVTSISPCAKWVPCIKMHVTFIKKWTPSKYGTTQLSQGVGQVWICPVYIRRGLEKRFNIWPLVHDEWYTSMLRTIFHYGFSRACLLDTSKRYIRHSKAL